MDFNQISPQYSPIQHSNTDSSNIFMLKKSNSLFNQNYFQFDFSRSNNKGASQNWSVSESLPILNQDGKYYTPTFILNADKKKYKIREKLYYSLHHKRIQSYLKEETQQLRIAQPFESNRYCIVCKKEFHDYLKHIYSESHQEKMHRSQFCNDINKLCQSFGNKPDYHREKILKTKMIKKMEKKVKMIQNVETKCQFESIY